MPEHDKSHNQINYPLYPVIIRNFLLPIQPIHASSNSNPLKNNTVSHLPQIKTPTISSPPRTQRSQFNTATVSNSKPNSNPYQNQQSQIPPSLPHPLQNQLSTHFILFYSYFCNIVGRRVEYYNLQYSLNLILRRRHLLDTCSARLFSC